MKKKIFNWLMVLVWAGLIFCLSAQPGLNSGMVVFWDVFLRKIAHAFVFGFLNYLVFRALRDYGLDQKKAIIWAFVLSLAYAASDEVHQSFVADRQARIKDVFIDGLGVFFASLIQVFFWQRKK